MFNLFFFQAEDGIRDAQESRGLGDVYKRQALDWLTLVRGAEIHLGERIDLIEQRAAQWRVQGLSLIHI